MALNLKNIHKYQKETNNDKKKERKKESKKKEPSFCKFLMHTWHFHLAVGLFITLSSNKNAWNTEPTCIELNQNNRKKILKTVKSYWGTFFKNWFFWPISNSS